MKRTSDIGIAAHVTYQEASDAAGSVMWMLGHFVGSLDGDMPTTEAIRHMENMHKIARLLYAVGDEKLSAD